MSDWRKLVSDKVSLKHWCEENKVDFARIDKDIGILQENGYLLKLAGKRRMTLYDWLVVFYKAESGDLDINDWCNENPVSYSRVRSAYRDLKSYGVAPRFIFKPATIREWIDLIGVARSSPISEIEWCQKHHLDFGEYQTAVSRIEKSKYRL